MNVDEIKISVVIPCYNSSQTISKCLDSVIFQTYKVAEIILVDDCSTDNTVEIINQYAGKYKDFIFKIVKLTENSGPSIARNTGIKHSLGNWIAFLDSDDCWDRLKIEKQVSEINQNVDLAMISCAFEKKKFSENVLKKTITFEMLCLKNYFETPTVLVRKDVIEKHLFDASQKYAEDHKVWLEILQNHKAIYLNEILARNVLNKRPFGDSGLSANIWKMERGELSNFKSLYKRGKLTLSKYLFYASFSILKFTRRYSIYIFRNIF